MSEFSPKYGEIEDISTTIRRITAPDPGPNMPVHIESIIKSLDGENVSHILVTHNHKDHSPAAQPLSEITGAKIYAYDPKDQQYLEDDIEEGIDRDFKPHINISDGHIINGSDWTIEAVHTPGHLSNHLCFAYAEEKALFTGDHIMGWSTTIVSPPDGNMQDYLDSLEKILRRDDEIYYPTHGKPIEDPKMLVQKLIDHRLKREKDIIEAIEAGADQLQLMVRSIYNNIPEKLYIAAERTIYAHLIRLVALGEITCDGVPNEASKYGLNK